MNWRQTSILLAASVILPAGSVVAAQQLNTSSTSVTQTSTFARSRKIAQASPDAPGFKMGRRGKRGMKQIFQKLNLSTEQQERIKAIREESKQSNSSLRQEMRQAREEMGKLMASDTNDDELKQQHEKIQTLKQQLGTQRFETMLKIRQVLTPEQRTEMAELKQQRWQNRRERMDSRNQ